MSKEPYQKIDFVPTENVLEIAHRISTWLKANASEVLRKDRSGLSRLNEYEGGHLYLELGGYVPNPEAPGKEASVETSFTVASGAAESLEPVEDPEGTYWYRRSYRAEVNWPSYGSQGAQLARLRAASIAAAVDLADKFDAEFKDAVVWSRGMTKAERDEWALKHRKDATRLKLLDAIKTAIHTNCKFMRVGDERFITCPPNCVDGEYVVELENKAYKAMPNTAGGSKLWFSRTK